MTSKTVLARHVYDRAHDREVLRALQGWETSRDIHPQLHHSKSALRHVARERDGKVVQKEKHFLHLVPQSQGEISSEALLLSPAFPFPIRIAFRKLAVIQQRLLQGPFAFPGYPVPDRFRDVLVSLRVSVVGLAFHQLHETEQSLRLHAPFSACR